MENEHPKLTVDDLLPLVLKQAKEHAMVLLDDEGCIVGWVCGAEQVFGYSGDDLCGQRLDVLFVDEDRRRGIPAHELHVAAQDGRAEDDRWHLRKDQTRIWVTGALSALRDSNQRLVGFVKIIRDRTDLRVQVESLENRVAALIKADEHKNVFLGTLAHELRNPLMPLVGAVELIRQLFPHEEALEFPLGMIQRQVDFLAALVNDLSDVTRIGVGKVQLAISQVALEPLVEEVVQSCAALIDERKHRVNILLPTVPIIVEGDPVRLRQILGNLLHNAVKYTDQEGTIWIKATVEGQEAVIRVEDTGLGIPAPMLPHIFELFTQVESSSAKAAGGLGLGLSIVKDLVNLHGGSIQVRSEGVGKGSEFTVRLPLQQPHPTTDETA